MRILPVSRTGAATAVLIGKRYFQGVKSTMPILDAGTSPKDTPNPKPSQTRRKYPLWVWLFAVTWFIYVTKVKMSIAKHVEQAEYRTIRVEELKQKINVIRAQNNVLQNDLEECQAQLKE